MDGKLQKAEFRNAAMFAPLKANFGLVDKDKDGAVDKAEMQAALEHDAPDARPPERGGRAADGRAHGQRHAERRSALTGLAEPS